MTERIGHGLQFESRTITTHGNPALRLDAIFPGKYDTRRAITSRIPHRNEHHET
jgi:hypothetical protein